MNHMIHLSLSWFVSILNHCFFSYESSGAHLDIFFSYETICPLPPQKTEKSKFALLREEKRREREEEEKIESQILGLCSFRAVVDFKGTSGANEESADHSGQTHCAQRDTDTHIYTHTHCLTAAIWLNEKVGLFIFNKATLILGLTFYDILFILESINSYIVIEGQSCLHKLKSCFFCV